MKSTKFHTADENSLGRYAGINKSVRPYTPNPTGTKAGVGDSRGLFRTGEIIGRDFGVRDSLTGRKEKPLTRSSR